MQSSGRQPKQKNGRSWQRRPSLKLTVGVSLCGKDYVVDYLRADDGKKGAMDFHDF